MASVGKTALRTIGWIASIGAAGAAVLWLNARTTPLIHRILAPLYEQSGPALSPMLLDALASLLGMTIAVSLFLTACTLIHIPLRRAATAVGVSLVLLVAWIVGISGMDHLLAVPLVGALLGGIAVALVRRFVRTRPATGSLA